MPHVQHPAGNRVCSTQERCPTACRSTRLATGPACSTELPQSCPRAAFRCPNNHTSHQSSSPLCQLAAQEGRLPLQPLATHAPCLHTTHHGLLLFIAEQLHYFLPLLLCQSLRCCCRCRRLSLQLLLPRRRWPSKWLALQLQRMQLLLNLHPRA